MQGMQRGRMAAPLILILCLLAGCSAQRMALPDGGYRYAAAGGLSATANTLTLQPVPLYGLPELAVGALWHQGEEPEFVLCDRHQRALDTSKPLVLYLDGTHELLRWRGSHVRAGSLCHYYQAAVAVMDRVAAAELAMLRVYFRSGTVEQRVSGTVADYFSRPKMFGPQQGFRRFVDALSGFSPAQRPARAQDVSLR